MSYYIRYIVIHCSASPDGVDIGAKEIKQYHTAPPPKGRGWRDIGYHKVVRINGRIELGRYENGDPFLEAHEVGAHAQGHNKNTLAFCWIGTNEDAMPRVQRAALVHLIADTCVKLRLPASSVLGHCEIAPESRKTCPNLNMDKLREEIDFKIRSLKHVS